MSIYLKKAILINRAPFKEMQFDFQENEIAILSSINGKGKTTLLSHLADSFYEMAKIAYQNVAHDNSAYYRVSSNVFSLNFDKPSLVYLRYQFGDVVIDYVDLRGNVSRQEYDSLINIENKIDFSVLEGEIRGQGVAKAFSSNCDKSMVEKIFNANILTYFPAYRYETPGYLSEIESNKLNFSSKMRFTGYMNRPIEVISGLKELTNWFMDIVLDLRSSDSSKMTFNNVNQILTELLKSKLGQEVRLGIGPRNLGISRLQVVNKITGSTIYPNLFNLSSGEVALLSLFGEILRQGDIIQMDHPMNEISGIVLVDEVDKHLHISLQKEALPRLIKLFPKIQFIISSHSPFLNLGLAEESLLRTRLLDMSSGLAIEPTKDSQYIEVYNLMVSENENFKKMYDSLQTKLMDNSKLQIVTEGKNTEHIEKALNILAKDLLDRVVIVKGAESSSGDQQLKNAFEIMSKSNHAGRFLFIWDCDSKSKVEPLLETEKFYKFCFQLNAENTKIKKGIENLYQEDLFTEEFYSTKTVETDYGGVKTESTFNKSLFTEKIKSLSDPNYFSKYELFIEKVRDLLD